MPNASFLFQGTDRILPSPRRVRWVREFGGHDVSYGGPSNAHHLFTFRPGFTENVGVGDRITIERTAGNNNYGITVGTVSVWRGRIGVSFVTPGAPSVLNLSVVLDPDAHPLPNAEFGSVNDSNSTWRVIAMENQIIPFLNQWYLVDLSDRQEVSANVLAGSLTHRETMAGLGLIMATTSTPTVSSNFNLGVLRSNDGGLNMIPLTTGPSFLNVNAKEATTPGTITIDGSGSQNDIIRVAGNNSYLNVAGDTNAQAFFPSGTTRVYGYRFLPQTGKTDNDTIASSIFLGDEIDQEVFYPNGWTFPFFRQFREWTSVSESGFLLERYTAPQPDKLMIPINYFNESQATTNIRTLAHKIQRNNFIFSFDKGNSPLFYGWCSKTSQPIYAAPTVLSCKFDCMGYVIYDLEN